MTTSKETINELLLKRLSEPDREVAYYAEAPEGGFRPISWAENRSLTLSLAAALADQGLQPGECVGILAEVRHEWVMCDFANLLARLITVGIYPTCTPDQVLYLLQHSECRALIISGAEALDRLAPTLTQCPSLSLIVTMDDDVDAPPGLNVTSLSTLVERGRALLEEHGEGPVLERAEAAEPDDLITLVYTSGTTGPPKGAMLTHRNLFHVTESVSQILDFGPDDRSIVYLPLAHILQRYSVYLGLRVGGMGYYSSRLTELGELLGEVKPTLLVAVPRVLEKIHARATARAAELGGVGQQVFHWAFDIGHQVASIKREGGEPNWFLTQRHKLADRLVLSKVRAKLGGQLRMVASGGAPLAVHLSEWFHAAGILVVEGYGLTETSAPASTGTHDTYRFGTVGKAIPQTDIAIADDGEVLVRGPGVFRGYFKNEEATAEAFRDDGFFHTGDIGELDEDGFLRITDRKKDILITAAGKNISPANIENLLKDHPLIGQAIVYGDARPYLVCALTLDPDEIEPWGREHGCAGISCEDLSRNADVLAQVEAHVTAVNARLARYETLKSWTLLDVPFTPDNGYLTPTLKLKRRVIVGDFGDQLEALYESNDSSGGGASPAR